MYSITADGAETVLYSFTGSEGVEPEAPLLDVGGTLYGTTSLGVANNTGCVFSITPAGVETAVYSFKSLGDSEGRDPTGVLTRVGDTLYGTTLYGGGGTGYGTLFAVTLAGVETVLHSFSGPDGSYPRTGLVKVGSKLFGTTAGGGTNGVIFQPPTPGSSSLYLLSPETTGLSPVA